MHVEKRKLAPVKPLFVSVDPVRDSIGQLKHYAQGILNIHFHL